MSKKTKLLLATLGLVALMAIPAFANEGAVKKYNFAQRTGRQTNIETMAGKIGISADELLEKKQAGVDCQDLMDEYGVDFDELRESRLAEQFKLVDEKVAEGVITEEEGQLIKERIQSYKFLSDGKGPHQGQREGMRLNIGSKQRMRGNAGRCLGLEE